MPIPYYIVLVITTALVLTHLRMKTVGRAYRDGFDRGFDRGRDEANRLHNVLPPVPTARHPLVRHVVQKRAEQPTPATAPVE